MSEPLTLNLFGGFRIVGSAGGPALPRKSRALLSFLVLEDRLVGRDQVGELLWPERGTEQQRHSLRQSLLVLRAAVGSSAIRTGGEGLGLQTQAIDSDVKSFLRMSASHEPENLSSSAHLYIGPLLHGFPALTAGFDDWLAGQRSRLDNIAMALLTRLAELNIAAGDHEEAIVHSERLLAIDPLREDAQRLLMLALNTAGRRTEALRQYEVSKDLLWSELAIGPAEETVSLFHRIRDQASVAIAPLPAASSPVVAPMPQSGAPWVAVLPFRSLGPDTVPPYFADGLGDDIVLRLAALAEPIVLSASTTLIFRDQAVDPRRVAHDLGVHYLVAGSLRCAGADLRLAVELLEGSTGRVLWSRAFETRDRDLFEAQDTIAASVVTTIIPQIHAAELRRVRAQRPEDLTAYDLFLHGRDIMFRLNRTNFNEAGALLRRAITRDGHYAAPCALLADWHSLRIGQGWSDAPESDTQQSQVANNEALERDPSNAKALAISAHSRSYLHRDYDGAIDLFDRALESAPNDASVWMWSASTYAYIGDGTEAVRRAERALTLSPRDPLIFRFHSTLCLAHFTNGNHDEAAKWGFLAARTGPSYTSNLRYTIAALVEAGRSDEAAPLIERLHELHPNFIVSEMISGHPYRDPAQRARIGKALVVAGLQA